MNKNLIIPDFKPLYSAAKKDYFLGTFVSKCGKWHITRCLEDKYFVFMARDPESHTILLSRKDYKDAKSKDLGKVYSLYIRIINNL